MSDLGSKIYMLLKGGFLMMRFISLEGHDHSILKNFASQSEKTME